MTSIYNRTWGHQEQAAKQFTGSIWRCCSFCLSVSIRNNVSTCIWISPSSLRKSFRFDLLPYKLARRFWCILPYVAMLCPDPIKPTNVYKPSRRFVRLRWRLSPPWQPFRCPTRKTYLTQSNACKNQSTSGSTWESTWGRIWGCLSNPFLPAPPGPNRITCFEHRQLPLRSYKK